MSARLENLPKWVIGLPKLFGEAICDKIVLFYLVEGRTSLWQIERCINRVDPSHIFHTVDIIAQVVRRRSIQNVLGNLIN
jgi:hypothetical protein